MKFFRDNKENDANVRLTVSHSRCLLVFLKSYQAWLLTLVPSFLFLLAQTIGAKVWNPAVIQHYTNASVQRQKSGPCPSDSSFCVQTSDSFSKREHQQRVFGSIRAWTSRLATRTRQGRPQIWMPRDEICRWRPQESWAGPQIRFDSAWGFGGARRVAKQAIKHYVRRYYSSAQKYTYPARADLSIGMGCFLYGGSIESQVAIHTS